VKFENGAIGSIETTRFAPGRKNHNRFEINGSRGSIVFDLERLNELGVYFEEGLNSGFRKIFITESSHPYIAPWWPPGHIIGYEHTFIHTVYDLLEAVDGQKMPIPNFEDGVIRKFCMPSKSLLNQAVGRLFKTPYGFSDKLPLLRAEPQRRD
jgi:predicted dehydrogenase